MNKNYKDSEAGSASSFSLDFATSALSSPSDEQEEVVAREKPMFGGIYGSSSNNDSLQSPNSQTEGDFDYYAFLGKYSSSTVIGKLSQNASDAWRWTLSGANPAARRKTFVQACYLGIAAIFGTLLRLILAQLFGQACSNPDSIGWIKDEAVLCVTSNGETTQNEGIIFADLPANLLGSFIMGLLQDGASLGLAINLPIAFLTPSNVLQSYDILHLALKTGFCGSLTTFSAWNSEMVVLMVGNHEAMPNRPSMLWKAFFGYVIGMETAIGSYVFGRTVAWWLHKWMNPDLADEQRGMCIRETKHGIAINRELPVLERRYLHALFETTNNVAGCSDPTTTLTREELAPLQRWRESTQESRRVESGVSDTLIELETALIARKEVITAEHDAISRQHGWDLRSLQEWLSKRNSGIESTHQPQFTAAGVAVTLGEDDTVWYAAPVAALVLMICWTILFLLMIHWNGKAAYKITYRTMAYSMLFAAPGALLRWKLSSLNNGKFLTDFWSGRFHRIHWLPLGTLCANVLGAMISISMVGWEYNITNSGFWGVATVRAIKIGFSGCLSTVSTFVSEIHKLTQIRLDRGYKYILATLLLSAGAGMTLFVIIV